MRPKASLLLPEWERQGLQSPVVPEANNSLMTPMLPTTKARRRKSFRSLGSRSPPPRGAGCHGGITTSVTLARPHSSPAA